MKNQFLALCTVTFFGVFMVVAANDSARTQILSNIQSEFVNVVNDLNMSGGEAAAISSATLQKKYNSYNSTDQFASAVPATTQRQLSVAMNHKVKILVMPGHEPNFGGAEYANLKEREMNVELANDLAKLLRNNPRYEVVVPRDNTAWSPTFSEYFKTEWESIVDFAKNRKSAMAELKKNGQIKSVKTGVPHNNAPVNIATRIYGINKWANENGVDIAIHIHFNDYPRRDTSSAGEYSGFAIYVPEHQYSNSGATKIIADSVFKRLSAFYATSDLPRESDGVVEEQDLIAIGSHNTLDAPSMLIEYGYIYEPEFQNKVARTETLQDMAFQTYLGLQDFFGSGNDVTLRHNSLVLPHIWEKNFQQNSSNTEDVFALQTALILENVYPPKGQNKNDCPRSGRYGPCTSTAVGQFQKKYGITGENGRVGDKTRTKLNDLYSLQLL